MRCRTFCAPDRLNAEKRQDVPLQPIGPKVLQTADVLEREQSTTRTTPYSTKAL